MTKVYMTAISPARGAEGELKQFISSCSRKNGWHSPLPLLVPLELYASPFPRDRVDKTGLKALPPLELTGPVRDREYVILRSSGFDSMAPESLYREIHGKTIPPRLKDSFINWEGMLLSPFTSSLPETRSSNGETEPSYANRTFRFPGWQLGLYKLTYNKDRKWWEDISCSCLWTVRKPAAQ
ncbi:MAG: hypothetical protein PQJ58_17450 [Spirochaetales bacterium]|nr:hypothetical protein [Spirochaetales bacterium]